MLHNSAYFQTHMERDDGQKKFPELNYIQRKKKDQKRTIL